MCQQWLEEASSPTPAKAKDFIQVCNDLQENTVSSLPSTGLDRLITLDRALWTVAASALACHIHFSGPSLHPDCPTPLTPDRLAIPDTQCLRHIVPRTQLDPRHSACSVLPCSGPPAWRKDGVRCLAGSGGQSTIFYHHTKCLGTLPLVSTGV